MFGWFKRSGGDVINKTTIVGNNNTLTITNQGAGAAQSFNPKVDWNTSPQAGGGLAAQL